MELAIAAGIAYLGYSFSSRHARAPPPRPTPADKGPDHAPPSELLAADRTASAARWDRAADPRVSGIITPNTNPNAGPLPFFRSAKKQNTNDAVKQTRMELFTGMTETDVSQTGTWQHKAVAGPRFAPAESRARVTSDGKAGNAMADPDLDRYRLTPKMNNVLPVQQLRVGPGVGVGADVAATDGFHPMFRVLPSEDALGSYRKSQLPGGMVAGGALVDKRASDEHVTKNRDAATFYEQSDRPGQATGAAHLAARRLLPELPRDPSTQRAHEHYVGGGAARRGQAVADPGLGSRGADRTAGFPVINPAAAAGGTATGQYAKLTLDGSRYDSQQREATAGGPVNLRGPVPGGAAGFAADLPATQRDMTAAFATGAGGTRIEGGAARPRDAPLATLRDLASGAPVLAGAAAVPATQFDNADRYAVLDRSAKRGAQNGARVEVAGRMNVLDPGAVNVAVHRAGGVQDRVKSHGAGIGRAATDLGQATAAPNKVSPENPWAADLSLAARQLSSNELALPAFAGAK
jgi:hypothetical protein